MTNETLETLRAARDLLSDPAHWTKGAHARDASGHPVSVHDESARCWCTVGAIGRSHAERFSDGRSTVAKLALNASLPEGEALIASYNDAAGTTHADILALFGRAISSLEKET